MGVQLFERSASIVFGQYGLIGAKVTGARIAFSIKKTRRSSANEARITVSNLSEANRKRLQTKGNGVSLLIGYGGNEQLLFSGEVNHGISKWSAPEWITEAECRDGQGALQRSTLARTWPAGTPRMAIVKALTSVMVGLASGVMESGPFVGAIGAPLSVSGSARKSLDMLAAQWGFSWSVQDGIVELREPGTIGKGLATAPVISQATGMIGVPEWTDDGLSVRCLCTPAIRPGVRVVVTSRTANGVFQVNEVSHSGDTHGNDWSTDVLCEEV